LKDSQNKLKTNFRRLDIIILYERGRKEREREREREREGFKRQGKKYF